MRICLTLALLCTLCACVTTEVDDDGRPISRKLDDEIVVDEDGRILARPTRLVAPHTIIINGGTPTEREIRLLGVEGLPEAKAPRAFAECQEWMAKYVAKEDEIFIKPALDSDLKNRVIYGIVYLYARENEDDPKSPLIPGAYRIMNQALLAKGLVRIRNIEEFPDPAMRERMQKIEDRAKELGVGIWSSKP
jgi:hypothetical protein